MVAFKFHVDEVFSQHYITCAIVYTSHLPGGVLKLFSYLGGTSLLSGVSDAPCMG